MKVWYQHGYFPQIELNIIEIRSILDSDFPHHVIVDDEGKEYDVTSFTWASGCTLRASLPDNW